MDPYFMEVLFTWLEREFPDAARIWNQAMNKRVGLNKASLSKVYMKAHANNISSIELPTLPEQDDWVYDTTRYGKPARSIVMVCHEFVC